ncbi:M15 family metallopeptidase [Thalassospira sp. MA62]|nr:M15 family metallopeptidase [Thalassospira sp. MA62]
MSYHLVGQALDFVPVNAKGDTLWNGYSDATIQKAIKEAKRLGFTWGGDWASFVDKPHLQYDKVQYGHDKTLKPSEVVVKPVVIKPLLTPPVSSMKIGTLVTKHELHAYAKPEWCTQSGAVVKAGQTRNVYAIQNGWYQIYSGE